MNNSLLMKDRIIKKLVKEILLINKKKIKKKYYRYSLNKEVFNKMYHSNSNQEGNKLLISKQTYHIVYK